METEFIMIENIKYPVLPERKREVGKETQMRRTFFNISENRSVYLWRRICNDTSDQTGNSGKERLDR